MPGRLAAKTESQLWQELIQRQEVYAQSLARLDELVLNSDATEEMLIARRLIEEAADIRRLAFAKYRQAMSELAEYNRR